jgi:DNA polymerase-3 subunit epsilon
MVRREARQRVVDVGGLIGKSVGKRTDYLVVGEQDLRKLKDGTKSSNMKKAEAAIANGGTVEVIGERDFLDLLVG